jgi:hypothetical protein
MHETAPVMPNLRIVPTSALVPHEDHDNQRSAPLIEKIKASGVWLNPPIVAPMSEDLGNGTYTGRYVILDGANRHYCISALGYPYILVQVVDYESNLVSLETWHHIVSGLSWFEFLRHLREVPNLRMDGTDLLSARASLARREAIAYTVLADNRAYTFACDATNFSERTRILNEIVNTYKTRGVLNRINTDSLSVARKLYPQAVAIVVFPHYEPPEILVAARDGIFLPPGITRHIISGRALRLSYPLDQLSENGQSLAEKNADLARWVQQRSAEKRIRYYAEPSYIFDE